MSIFFDVGIKIEIFLEGVIEQDTSLNIHLGNYMTISLRVPLSPDIYNFQNDRRGGLEMNHGVLYSKVRQSRVQAKCSLNLFSFKFYLLVR